MLVIARNILKNTDNNNQCIDKRYTISEYISNKTNANKIFLWIVTLQIYANL